MTHQATDTASAALVKQIEALERIRPSELDGEELFNRNGEYVSLWEVQQLCLASLPAPAALPILQAESSVHAACRASVLSDVHGHVVGALPIRVERLGGQRTSYVQRATILDWLEVEIEKCELPAPAAPDFQHARAEKWLAAYERTKLRLEEVQALVLALQAHAKEHGWQDYDDPIADLLAWEATPPAAPEEEKVGGE